MLSLKIKSINLTALFLALSCFLFISCSGEKKAKLDDKKAKPENLVRALEIKQSSFLQKRIFEGNLKPYRSSMLNFESSGKLKKILVEENQTVKKGQVLGRIDDWRYQIAHDRMKSIYQKALNDFKRAERLYKSKSLAQKFFLDAKFGLEQAEINFKNAKAELERCTLRSPYQGIITRKMLEPGETVSPARPVLEIASMERLELNVMVSQDQVSELRQGESAKIYIGQKEAEIYDAKIKRIALISDPRAALFPVSIEVANADFKLRAGMRAKAELITKKIKPAWFVPETSIRQGLTEKNILFVDKAGNVKSSAMGDPIRYRGFLIYSEWNFPGKYVITKGKELVEPGQTIKYVLENNDKSSLSKLSE